MYFFSDSRALFAKQFAALNAQNDAEKQKNAEQVKIFVNDFFVTNKVN